GDSASLQPESGDFGYVMQFLDKVPPESFGKKGAATVSSYSPRRGILFQGIAMTGRHFLWIASIPCALLLVRGPLEAQQKSSQSKQAQQAKQEALVQARQGMNLLLARARSLAASDPAQAYQLLRRELNRLLADTELPRDGRMDLIVRVEEQMKAVQPMLAQKG